jgi:predicted DNA-binding WGR domain protein
MSNSHHTPQITIQLLVLERIDRAQNMARYYVLSIEPTLFGDTAMVREWGRIGASGRRRIELHSERADAGVALNTWLNRKIQRGYALRHAGNVAQPKR